jgi:hypothetical protein
MNGKKKLIFTILLLIVCTSICAGCFETKTGNQTGNVLATGTPATMITQQVSSLCPPPGNATPWIIINPIGNHYIGDVFEINGTTNLRTEEKINVAISGIVIGAPYPGIPGPTKGSLGMAKIRGGDCGINVWFYTANTSEFNTPFYIVTAGAENWTVQNDTRFEVSMPPVKTAKEMGYNG